ncbi:NAD(P)-dependent alcohol dehydrogenase [Ktedonosporobacter rubrisoli]|uniref:NAD(P)-dependent alcohol dehydrogenase n=1 Tax=Ktedonosporobacter rubrisoli TaxID=2509675 RepID=A0A4P6JP24_KTERU|nr:NAD(P)-dependent alcohol dehydrogenase [Ktedonosporobacter rubrisoli]QBD76822.1 NAD(P)-dependent alcohol dehydrogenase [Ktedonosporobacter rubrisoli]
MQAYQIQQSTDRTALSLTERPIPQPARDQVLIRVRAVSLNARDIQIMHGHYPAAIAFPLVPVSDGVGEVVAVGHAVQRVKVGDRVAGIFRQKWIAGNASPAIRQSTLGGPLDGLLQEYAVLNEEGVVLVPAHLSDEEAATLPCAATTAWSELFTRGQLKAGETVLVQGTGGVSLFALQFAKLAGARVIVTSRSDEKLERVRALGADEVINTEKTPAWAARVRDLTAGYGADYLIEVVGDLAQSLQAVAYGGQISLVGFLGQRIAKIDIAQAIVGMVRLQGANAGHREAFEAMNRAIALHHLHPVIDQTFSFEDAPEAFRYMEQGGYLGKICIRL